MLCCEECPATDVHCTSVAGHSSQSATTSSLTLARKIQLPDDGLRTETCRSVFNILMCTFYKFYICAVVGIIIE